MMAIQTGIPILPVTSNGAFKIMPKTSLLFRPGHITITIGDPIVTEGLTEKDVPELMEKTRAAIAANLDLDYDPFARPHSALRRSARSGERYVILKRIENGAHSRERFRINRPKGWIITIRCQRSQSVGEYTCEVIFNDVQYS